MDLTVVVNGDDADHGLGLIVASEQHRTRTHPLGRVSISQRRPAKAVVILSVEVSYEIEIVHRVTTLRVNPHDTG